VLADTRPLWRDWLADAARRARVELGDLPEDRAAAARILDERLGDWRPLLERFAADRAPLHFRPRPDTGAALRRLHAAGNRIVVVTDAPRELAEIALAHLGVARRVLEPVVPERSRVGENAVEVEGQGMHRSRC